MCKEEMELLTNNSPVSTTSKIFQTSPEIKNGLVALEEKRKIVLK